MFIGSFRFNQYCPNTMSFVFYAIDFNLACLLQKVDPSIRSDAQMVCLHTPERKPNHDLSLPPSVSMAVVQLNFDALDNDTPTSPVRPHSSKSFFRSQSLGPNVSTTSQLTSMTSLYSTSMSPSEFPEAAATDLPDGEPPNIDPLSKSLQESALSGNLRARERGKKRGSVFRNLRMREFCNLFPLVPTS